MITGFRQWTSKWLTNSWMANPDFDAAMAHIGWAALAMIVVGKPWFIVVVEVLAAWKEFWFDANYEIPKQTNADNWEDFITYTIGAVAGLVYILL